MVEHGRTVSNASGMKAIEQNRLVADQQERRIATIPDDDLAAKRLPIAVRGRNVRHVIRRNAVKLRKVSLLSLIEGHNG